MANPFEVPKEIEHNALVLERMKVAVHERMSGQLAADLMIQQHEDFMRDHLITRLATYVLTDHLATEDVTAEFSKTVALSDEREVPGPRLTVVPPAVGVLAITTLGIVLGNLLALAAAMLFAVLFVVIYAANPPQTVALQDEQEVSGTVTVPVKSYAAFPENETVYPRDLGRIVRHQVVEAPSVRYHDAN